MHPAPQPSRSLPAALLAAAVLLASGALLHGTPLDTAAFHALNRLGAHWPTLWAMLSVAGLGLSAFTVLAALHPGNQRQAMQPVAALLWCFPIGGALTHALKAWIAHPRPVAALGADAVVVVGEPLLRGAMPSGHAVTAVAVLGLCLLAGRLTRLQRGGLLGLAGLVLLSRTAVGAHWPADLLAGAGLGLVTALAGWRLSGRTGLLDWLCRRRGQQVLAVAQIGCGVVIAVLHSGYALALPLQWTLGVWSVATGLRRLGRTGLLPRQRRTVPASVLSVGPGPG